MDREYLIESYVDENGDYVPYDRNEARILLSDLESVLSAVGGTFVASAIRHRDEDGNFVTTGIAVKWDSFAPALKDKPDSSSEPGPVEDPVAA